MKSIKEYIREQQQVNEFLVTGAIIAGLALAWGQWYGQDHSTGELSKRDRNSKKSGGSSEGGGFFKKLGGFFAGLTGLAIAGVKKATGKGDSEEMSIEDKRKEELAEIDHKIAMIKKQKELDELTKDEKEEIKSLENKKKEVESDTSDDAIEFTPEKAMALASKNLKDEPDEVKRTQLQKHLDLMRASQYDADGKPRTDDDAAAWLDENVAEEDMAALMKVTEDRLGDEDFNEALAKKFEEAAGTVSQEDVDKERDEAQKVAKDLGPKLEADAEKRREIMEKASKAKLAAENKDKIKGLDKAIADAEANGDEVAIKAAKMNRAKYLYEAEKAVLDGEHELAEFNANCESGEFLNTIITDRKERCENEIKAAQTKIDDVNKKFTQELQDLGASADEIKEVIPESEPEKTKEPKDNPKDGEKPKDKSEEDNPKDDKDSKDDDKPKDKPKGEDKPKGDEESDEDFERFANDKYTNPAQIWKRQHNKLSGGMSKRYYNKKGNSISAKEFHDKMARYKEAMKSKNESYVSFEDYLIEHLS